MEPAPGTVPLAQYSDFTTQLKNIKEILNSKTKTNENVNNDLFEQTNRNIDSLLVGIESKIKAASVVDTTESTILESNLAENRFKESCKAKSNTY